MIKPASRTMLYQDVLSQMVATIKEGYWRPGEKIPSEMDLAAQFRVGRNSIREAEKSLAVFGIVDSRPGQGTFVCNDALRKISNTEFLKYLSDDSTWVELMQVRLLLEVQLAYWAAEKAGVEDVEKLKSIMEISRNSLTDKHPRDPEYLRIHADFHEAIAEIAGNKLALRLLRSIRCEIDAQRHKYLHLTERDWEIMMGEHQRIIEHIENREPGLAREAMRLHLMAGLQKVVPQMNIED